MSGADATSTRSPLLHSSPPSPLIGVLLIGGQSSRMGQHKASLLWRGVPLYLHCLHLLLPHCSSVLLSLPSTHPLFPSLSSSPLPPRVHLLPDDSSLGDIGPAVALLSAHSAYPSCPLLVFAVDFPLTPPLAFTHLLSSHRASSPPSPVTCYLHEEDGAPEPLMAVWEVEGLEALKRNVERGKTGPCSTIRQLLGLPQKRKTGRRAGKQGECAKDGQGSREERGEGRKEEGQEERKEGLVASLVECPVEGTDAPAMAGLLRPLSPVWLFNCNTAEQWRAAEELDQQLGASREMG